MNKSIKLLTQNQLESCLQIVINQVNAGKPSYTRKDVLHLLKVIYNELLHICVLNERDGFCIVQEENEVLQ